MMGKSISWMVAIGIALFSVHAFHQYFFIWKNYATLVYAIVSGTGSAVLLARLIWHGQKEKER